MSRTACLAVVATACLLVSPVVAQTEPGPITRVVLWGTKAGASEAFEAGLVKHNAFHKAQGDRLPHHTWEIVTGPDAGMYDRVAPGRNWSDFDREDAWADADETDSAKNVTPNVASAVPSFWLFKADVSRQKRDTPPAMASLIWFKVKLGEGETFEYLVKKFHEAIVKTNWPTHYSWFQMINGLEGPLYALSLPRDNWAGMAPPEKPFPAMLEEAYGRVEAGILLEQWDATLVSVRSEVVRFRADLSYMPE